MYRSGGGGDANVPALPVRRSAVSIQSPITPQLAPRLQTFVQQRSTTSTVRPQLPASSSWSLWSSSSRLNLANLDQRVDSSRSRSMNDYREFPTTAALTTTTTSSTTTATVRVGDGHSAGRSLSETDHTSSPPPPRNAGLSESRRKNDSGGDDDRGKKKKTSGSTTMSECRESIICQRCGRCRCQECARRTAPGRRAVEICSCVSCVRRVAAVRRHGDGNDEQDPCGCSPCRSDCCRRWALLVVLSVFLPCLCFYWPLRCVVGACSRCAGRGKVRGCRCVERYTPALGRSSPSTAESIVVDRVTST